MGELLKMQFRPTRMVPATINQGSMASQMTTAMTNNPTTGITRFELPLRGESLEA